MKLTSISISNYRSIEKLSFPIEQVDGSLTFTLIGINESGKSNILTAISLLDPKSKPAQRIDFAADDESIKIMATYELTDDDMNVFKETLVEENFDARLLDQVDILKLELGVHFLPTDPPTRSEMYNITFSKQLFPDYMLGPEGPILKIDSTTDEDFDLEEYFDQNLSNYFFQFSHTIVFWKSNPEHLIDQPINLEAFVINPSESSVPLTNCFHLAGIDDISGAFQKLKADPAQVHELQERLGDAVTRHINRIWPNHPVTIKFNIDGQNLTFLVADNELKFKVKTVSQRSEGFKQFISFLLTVSAESANKKLSNCLLLLDEPETHLHPQAQENLKDELIKLTEGTSGNVVIFATHSNYMIDKSHMERCYRVVKRSGNGRTEIIAIPPGASSYSEVNFEVFEIVSNDYHNELYGYLELDHKSKLDDLPKDKTWLNSKTKVEKEVSLSEYIRHSFHHPENTSNPKFTVKELLKSIHILRNLKQQSPKE